MIKLIIGFRRSKALFFAVLAMCSGSVVGLAKTLEPNVEAWIQEVEERRQQVDALEPAAQKLAAKRAQFELHQRYPILTDWVHQDAAPHGWRLFISSKSEQTEKSLLTQLGVSEISSDSSERLRAYVVACKVRRTQRLDSVLKTWAPFAFAEGHSVFSSFIGYTEGLSDARKERFFKGGARLTLLHFDEGESFGRAEHIINDPQGMIRDVEVSYDLQRLLFAWKKSDRLDDFHIYEYGLKDQKSRQLTFGLGRADYEPVYLPDGDILFASTRPEQSVPCWWTEISNLYRMSGNGKHIRRLAVDQVHTLYPQVLNNGRVTYTRWDYSDRGQNYPHPVFSMDPDGQAQRTFYGGNSWFPTSLLHNRAIPGSHKTMAIAAGHHTRQHGKLVTVDVREGRDEGKGIKFLAPLREPEYERVDVAQQEGDQFRYPFPLSEQELLISYMPDWGYAPSNAVKKAGIKHQRAQYGDLNDYALYWMNVAGEREYLYGDEALGVHRPVALGYKPEQPAIPDTVDYTKNTGTLYVHDVYKGIGLEGIERGAAKKIRVVRLNYRAAGVGKTRNLGVGGRSINSAPVSIANGSWDVKEILGDVEIHADGSALFEVPANESIYLQVLDEHSRVIQTTRTWDTIRPGEQKACVGCHDKANANFHPYEPEDTLAWKHGVQTLQPFYGPTRGFSFSKEIQPILDMRCISCHDGQDAERMDLRGYPVTDATLNKRLWSRSYLNLTEAKRTKEGDYQAKPEKGWVTWISKMSRPTELPPYFSGAAKSPLLSMLDEGHHDVKLTVEDSHKLAAWMDLLVPFSGDYREGNQWDEKEMRYYDYYEGKRKEQHKEEQQYISSHLARRGVDTMGDTKNPAAFVHSVYSPVWAKTDWSLTKGQTSSLQTKKPFVFDQVSIQIRAEQPVKLKLMQGAKTLHQFSFAEGEHSAKWLSGGKVLRNKELHLVADQDVHLSDVKVWGVSEDQLPEWKGFKPHLHL